MFVGDSLVITFNARNFEASDPNCSAPTRAAALPWSAIMAAGFETQSPETVGLAAAKSAFGLVEGAFLPVPGLIGPAFLWLLAVLSFGPVAVAAGVSIGDDVSAPALDSGVSPIAVGEPRWPQRHHLSVPRLCSQNLA